METAEAILHRCSLFQSVTQDEVREILRDIPHSRRTFSKGAKIFLRGEVCESLLIIICGEVYTHMDITPEKTISMESLRAPEAIAAGVLFAQDNTLPVSATALTEVEVLAFPKKSVMQLFRRYENFMVNYIRDMGNKIVFLAEKIKVLKFTTLRQRVASYLLDLSQKQASLEIRLPFSKEALANLFGAARPSISRIFMEMIAEGVISGEGRVIHVLDRKALEACLLIAE